MEATVCTGRQLQHFSSGCLKRIELSGILLHTLCDTSWTNWEVLLNMLSIIPYTNVDVRELELSRHRPRHWTLWLSSLRIMSKLHRPIATVCFRLTCAQRRSFPRLMGPSLVSYHETQKIHLRVPEASVR